MPTSGKKAEPAHDRPSPTHSNNRAFRKEAIQKTIMAMTLGKDVSQLFPDVLKNIATADLDQKKLVYLYLMYVCRILVFASTHPHKLSGTMPNHTPISASLPSTPSFRTPKTPTRSFVHWQSERWAVSELTR